MDFDHALLGLLEDEPKDRDPNYHYCEACDGEGGACYVCGGTGRIPKSRVEKEAK